MRQQSNTTVELESDKCVSLSLLVLSDLCVLDMTIDTIYRCLSYLPTRHSAYSIYTEQENGV